MENMSGAISSSITFYLAGRGLSRWVAYSLFLLLFAACQSGPDENQVAVETFLEKEVTDRLALYQRILNQQCRDNVLEEAGKIADSILISEARLKRDSMGKPPKPTKPDRPELKTLKDSLSLDPLFRDTVGGE